MSQSRYLTAITQQPSEGFTAAATVYNSMIWLKNSASSCICFSLFIQQRHSIWRQSYLQKRALNEDNWHRKLKVQVLRISSVFWTLTSIWIRLFTPLIHSALHRSRSKVHWHQQWEFHQWL